MMKIGNMFKHIQTSATMKLYLAYFSCRDEKIKEQYVI